MVTNVGDKDLATSTTGSTTVASASVASTATHAAVEAASGTAGTGGLKSRFGFAVLGEAVLLVYDSRREVL